MNNINKLRLSSYIPLLITTLKMKVFLDAIESGMDAHVAKPVQIDNLKSTIRQVLDSRAEQPEGNDA